MKKQFSSLVLAASCAGLLAAPAHGASVGVDPNPLAACALSAGRPAPDVFHNGHMTGSARIDCQLPGSSNVELRVCVETLAGGAFVNVACNTQYFTMSGLFNKGITMTAYCDTFQPVWRTVAFARVQYTSWEVLEDTSEPSVGKCGLSTDRPS